MPSKPRRRLCALLGVALLQGSVWGAPASPRGFESSREKLWGLAYERSPTLNASQAAVERARALRRQAWAAWFPTLDLQLSQNVSKDYSFLTSGVLPAGISVGEPRQVNLALWSLQASLPLYRRSVHLGLQGASREVALAEQELALAQWEFEAELSEALGRFLVEAFKVEALETSLLSARSRLKETQARHRLGQGTQLDLLRAEANVVSLESRSLAYGQTRTAARHRIWEVAGISEEDWKALGLEPALQEEKALAAAVEGLGKRRISPALNQWLSATPEALRERVSREGPYGRRVGERRELAAVRSSQVLAPAWPELAVQGRLFKQSPNWGSTFGGGQQSYSLGIALKVPFNLGGGLFWGIQESRALDREAEVEQARALRLLWSQAENERLRVAALKASERSLELNVKQHEEILRLSQRSHQLGKTTLVDLLNAQDDLLESKINWAQARVDLGVALLRFGNYVGVGHEGSGSAVCTRCRELLPAGEAEGSEGGKDGG